MNNDIHSFNGKNGTPQDKLAIATLWIIGVIFLIIFIIVVNH